LGTPNGRWHWDGGFRPGLGWIQAGYGIDLGTANTVVAGVDGTLLLNEPSVMAVRADGDRKGQLVAVGGAAKALVGRTPIGMATVRPLEDGVITDLQTARSFIVAILKRVKRHPWQVMPPQAVIGVPWGATELEKRALIEAVEEAGVGHVDLVPEPIAGALGSGLNPLETRARMVVDIGGGTAEVTAFCFGGILAARSCRTAGDEMTLAVHQYLRVEHKMLVGELAAENLKMQLSRNGSGPRSLIAEGRDLASDRARTQELSVDELDAALRPVTDSIIQALASCLQDMPAQAVSDVMQDGVLVFGGGSLVGGFGHRLEEAFGFAVHQAERPLTCVAEGAAMCLRRPEIVKAFG
jgi:rod shape-determining protein MreB